MIPLLVTDNSIWDRRSSGDRLLGNAGQRERRRGWTFVQAFLFLETAVGLPWWTGEGQGLTTPVLVCIGMNIPLSFWDGEERGLSVRRQDLNFASGAGIRGWHWP